ncbi:unnamed protein product [Schistosoma curassoni]|uniref:Non-specific serine/threonine protein kinase n=1 Tax=Schistosoma curassoni TaxID=6186 RepID=A0A183KRK8_9TREM|nr:unnamed protein product [Schistosoma curassoni]
MENASWWNERLWKSFVDHPSYLNNGMNEYEQSIGGVRYTSQQSSNVKQLRSSNIPTVSTIPDISNIIRSNSDSNYQNVTNFDSQTTVFQDNSTRRSSNPQLCSNNLFQQFCSRHAINNMHSIYGNRSRPLGSLRVYYLTRPHSAVTFGRSTSLQRPPQESQNIKSCMTVSSPLSTRRLTSTDLCFSKENSFSTLLPGTTSSSVKRSNSIDCSGKICKLHERSATPSLCENLSKKMINSNPCTRRGSAVKARSSLVDTLQQKSQPPRRVSSAYGSDKTIRYGNRITNTLNVDHDHSDYSRIRNIFEEPTQQFFTTTSPNEYISLNSARKLNDQLTTTNQHSSIVQNKKSDTDIHKQLSKTSVLSVTPVSFQNIKFFKYPSSPKKSGKSKLGTPLNKSEQVKPLFEKSEIDFIPTYNANQNTTKNITASDDNDSKLKCNAPSQEENKLPVAIKSNDTIIIEEDVNVCHENSSKCDFIKKEPVEIIETTANAVMISELSAKEDKTDSVIPPKEELRDLCKSPEFTKVASKFLMSDDQISVVFRNPDTEECQSLSQVDELCNSGGIGAKLDMEHLILSTTSENKNSDSDDTLQSELISCENDQSSSNSTHKSLEFIAERIDEIQPDNIFNENVSNTPSVNESIIVEDESREMFPSGNHIKEIKKSNLCDEVEKTSMHGEPRKCLSISKSNNTEQLPYRFSSSTKLITQNDLSYTDENLSSCDFVITNSFPIKSILKRPKSFAKSQTDSKVSNKTLNVTVNDEIGSTIYNTNLTGLTFYETNNQGTSSIRPFSANSWKSEIPNIVANSVIRNFDEDLNITNISTTNNYNITTIRPKSSTLKSKLYTQSKDKLTSNRSNRPGVRFDIKNNSILEFYSHDIINKS